MKRLAPFFIAALLTAPFLFAAPGKFLVISWNNPSREWTQRLGISAIRMGCSSAPSGCAQAASSVARSEHVSSVLITILLKPATVTQLAADYARLSSSHPEIVEIGFDDFVRQAGNTGLTGQPLSSLLNDFAARLHSSGSHLKWGVTVYQDELWNGRLANLALADDTRGAVDAVHLFPHYRKEPVPLQKSIAEAKRLFPNAAIVLGNYAYDRREYLPCSPQGARCSGQEEISLFNCHLRESLNLAEQGNVAGLEIYPGNFGQEASWKIWENPRSCKQGERLQCVQNSQTMAEDLRKAFDSGGGGAH